MRELILLIAVAAAFVLGYIMVKNLTGFAEKNYKGDDVYKADCLKQCMRLGFSNSVSTDTAADILKEYSIKHPDITVAFLSGTEEELLDMLCQNGVDRVFICGKERKYSDRGLHADSILLNGTPVSEIKRTYLGK